MNVADPIHILGVFVRLWVEHVKESRKATGGDTW